MLEKWGQTYLVFSLRSPLAFIEDSLEQGMSRSEKTHFYQHRKDTLPR